MSRTVKFLENVKSNEDSEEDEKSTSPRLWSFKLLENNIEDQIISIHEENLEENSNDDNEAEESLEAKRRKEDSTEKPESKRIPRRKTKGVPKERFSYKVKNSFSLSKYPKTLEDIKILPKIEQKKLHQAMREERNSLEKNEVFELTNLPKGK